MTIEQVLEKEIDESQRWLNLEKGESTYKRDLAIRIELINWVLENMKNPDIHICHLIESRMSEIILKINQCTESEHHREVPRTLSSSSHQVRPI